MLGLVVLAFIVLPFVELALLIWIGQQIGLWPTVAIVLGTGLLGGLLVRTQGPRAWREITEAWRKGRVPGTELVAGALFLVGAAFLLTPGVITDTAGFLLMLPVARRLAAKGVIRFFKGRATLVHVSTGRSPGGSGGMGAAGGGGGDAGRTVDVEGDVRDTEEDGEGR